MTHNLVSLLNNRFFALFNSDVDSWQHSEKVEHGAQLQTFPYPQASKSFLYSNAFMAKSGAQTLMFKSVTDKPTDRLKKLNVSMKSKPHQTWHGDRGPRARSCASKTFGVWRIVSPLGGAENLRATRPPQLKTPNNSITPWANPTKI